MQIVPTDIPQVRILVPRRFEDGRGFLSETYNRAMLREAGLDVDFVQENHSFSVARGTVRGLHYQVPPAAQAKLVRVASGSVLDVAVDLRPESGTFGRHVAVELSADNWKQVFIPEGFAHGFCTLEPRTHVIYKLTDYYAPQHERGVRWDDPALGIDWPVTAGEAVLSDRDRAFPPFQAD